MIIASDLQKTFVRGFGPFRQETPVLKGFDFHANAGQVTGVLGPNGAGKTTLFRIISGLEKPTSGTIFVNGINPWDNPKFSRGNISLLPEDPGIAGDVSGYDHLWIFAIMMGLEKSHISPALEAVKEALGLGKFWTRPSSGYSRGQKARISLARIHLMPQASVYIFDEPSNGLDFEGVSRLHSFIRALADQGKTVLVASHILSDLRHLCDRIVGIDDGHAASQETLKSWLEAHEQVRARVGEQTVASLLQGKEEEK